MTAPLFTVPSLDGVVVGGTVILQGPEAHHAATVRRVRVGEDVLLADGSPTLAHAVVERVVGGRDAEVLARVTHLDNVALGGPRFVLVQALAKDGRDLQAVESATEVGVDQVIPWQAERSVVHWRGEKVDKALAKWRALVAAASKQARRPDVPDVSAPVTTRGLAELLASSDAAYLLHEDATTPLAVADLPESGDVHLVVGPEGGISPAEMEALIQAGGVPVRLGRTILRSSSAGPAALAVLSARSRWR